MRVERTVRLRDVEGREGWRGLEGILEKTERRLSVISELFVVQAGRAFRCAL